MKFNVGDKVYFQWEALEDSKIKAVVVSLEPPLEVRGGIPIAFPYEIEFPDGTLILAHEHELMLR